MKIHKRQTADAVQMVYIEFHYVISLSLILYTKFNVQMCSHHARLHHHIHAANIVGTNIPQF